MYLFEKKISDLQVQKNRRELEIMIQECILTAIRESIPTEAIIRAYMDETVEEEEEVFIEPVEDESTKKAVDGENEADASLNQVTSEDIQKVEPELPPVLSVKNMDDEKVTTRLTFNDMDEQSDGTAVAAPKDIDTLEKISDERYAQRKLEEEDDDEDDEMPERIKIHMDDNANLNDVFDLDNNGSASSSSSSSSSSGNTGQTSLVLDDIEDL